jgi:hypothetical protein
MKWRRVQGRPSPQNIEVNNKNLSQLLHKSKDDIMVQFNRQDWEKLNLNLNKREMLQGYVLITKNHYFIPVLTYASVENLIPRRMAILEPHTGSTALFYKTDKVLYILGLDNNEKVNISAQNMPLDLKYKFQFWRYVSQDPIPDIHKFTGVSKEEDIVFYNVNEDVKSKITTLYQNIIQQLASVSNTTDTPTQDLPTVQSTLEDLKAMCIKDQLINEDEVFDKEELLRRIYHHALANS